MSAKVAVKSNVIKPLNPSDFNEEQIVFGMLGDSYDSNSFPKALTQIKRIIQNYEDMGGCILWEYGDTNIDPIIWGKKINSVFLNKRSCFQIYHP